MIDKWRINVALPEKDLKYYKDAMISRIWQNFILPRIRRKVQIKEILKYSLSTNQEIDYQIPNDICSLINHLLPIFRGLIMKWIILTYLYTTTKNWLMK